MKQLLKTIKTKKAYTYIHVYVVNVLKLVNSLEFYQGFILCIYIYIFIQSKSRLASLSSGLVFKGL